MLDEGVMKQLVFMIFAVVLAKASVASEELLFTVPPLKKEQPTIESIYRTGNDIIVSTEEYDPKEKEWNRFFWRLDEKNVKMMIKDEKIDSGKRKLGCIVGDNVKFGVNVTVMPGKKIWPNLLIPPCVTVKDDMKEQPVLK